LTPDAKLIAGEREVNLYRRDRVKALADALLDEAKKATGN
jgi:hypothetical protein